jgi:hypothetical protein
MLLLCPSTLLHLYHIAVCRSQNKGRALTTVYQRDGLSPSLFYKGGQVIMFFTCRMMVPRVVEQDARLAWKHNPKYGQLIK